MVYKAVECSNPTCGAYLAKNLKVCPYCGSATDPIETKEINQLDLEK